MLNKLKFLYPTCTLWMLHLSVVLMAQCAGCSLISYLQAADQGAYETVNSCSTCLNRLNLLTVFSECLCRLIGCSAAGRGMHTDVPWEIFTFITAWQRVIKHLKPWLLWKLCLN